MSRRRVNREASPKKKTRASRGTRQPSDWTVKGKAQWRSTAQLLWRAWPLRKQKLKEGSFKVGRKEWNTCEECGEAFPMTERKEVETKSGKNKGKVKVKNVSNFQIDHIEAAGGFYKMHEAVEWIKRLLLLNMEDVQRLCVACHKKKTKEEQAEAARLRKEKAE